ncbi:transmembrane alpha-helix domain-containing [Pyrenophora seminiperda CCB06]|uniref:Transmembrane alpha-helix domain-containing n=1 Tax=Pyrenophora seminiperda CCB06 TaxID=1302712 RepID=A0A3M7M7W8_9PLEO|nr:transmembrane alpha-helix domain-containing [Pyrenophora seminiperda CCB06]
MVQLGSRVSMAFRLVFAAAILHRVSGSTFATFTDDQCKNSFQSIQAENGYPNGTCLRLADNGKFGSFQLVGLDPGCSATIYGADAEEFVPCSSTALQFAQLATCYNASWVYYSVDSCTPPQSSSISRAPSRATSTPSSTPNPSSKNNHIGAIVGGVIGGVCALALIGLAVFLVLRRRRNKKTALEQQPPEVPHPPEAHGNDINELSPEDVKPEIYTAEAKPHEIGRNSMFIPREQPPAELEGNSAPIVQEQEKRDP